MTTATPLKLAWIAGSALVLLSASMLLSPTPRASARAQVTKGGGVVQPGSPSEGGSEGSVARQKAQRQAPAAGAPEARVAPGFPPGGAFPPQGGIARGFVSRVGSFELSGGTGLGLYRWLDAPQDRRNPYRFWRSDLAFESREQVFFGGAGSNSVGAPRFLDSHLYRDVASPFWLAFGAQPNPDGTWNIAFSLDRRSWYWWDDDARGFDLGGFAVPFGAPGQP
ncbi:hypothetical protein [Tautonia plasticadhaerens]|uniref:Uncharacterized protein n=1 Tax=Tautonia plasticadhaerens TaxID=2527974 RepID=A0A518GW71_9BACT|nr:hypothetical protein [Tautonia plasticadhaerens]QDV32850.1 hypothetical protein ElP_06900 [Tautonia plasticadhaerens]